jgi:hypothetical protein
MSQPGMNKMKRTIIKIGYKVQGQVPNLELKLYTSTGTYILKLLQMKSLTEIDSDIF